MFKRTTYALLALIMALSQSTVPVYAVATDDVSVQDEQETLSENEKNQTTMETTNSVSGNEGIPEGETDSAAEDSTNEILPETSDSVSVNQVNKEEKEKDTTKGEKTTESKLTPSPAVVVNSGTGEMDYDPLYDPSSEELLDMLVGEIFPDPDPQPKFSMFSMVAPTYLKGEMLDLYNTVSAQLKDAAVNGGSTEIILPESHPYVLSLNGKTREEILQKWANDIPLIYDYMVSQNPEYLYWYDYRFFYNCTINYNQSKIENLWVGFKVNPVYSGGEYIVDAGKINQATKARENAKNIAQEIKNDSSLSSTEAKLVAIKNKICELVSYNYKAVEGGWNGGHDPWQIVWAFDDDSSTNVVCEGYAKSFKLLCNMVFEPSDLTCLCVCGYSEFSNGSRGLHMWNVVHWKGESYLVDMTACDTGDNGPYNGYFMASPKNMPEYWEYIEPNTYKTKTHIPSEKPYSYIPSGASLTYNENTVARFGKEILTLGAVAPSYIITAHGANVTLEGQSEEVTQVKAGEKVKLTAQNPPAGKEFAGWKIISGITVEGKCKEKTMTFTMPENDVEIQPLFKKKIQLQVSTPIEGTKYTYTGNQIQPNITVKNNELKAGTDYELQYSNNVNVGTAKLQIVPLEDSEYIFSSYVYTYEIIAATIQEGQNLTAVQAPVKGGVLDTAVTLPEGADYTAEIQWFEGENTTGTAVTGTAKMDTVYTAKITLTPDTNHTFSGSKATFKVDGTVWMAKNDGNNMVLTHTFPKTEKLALTEIILSSDKTEITVPVAEPNAESSSNVVLTATGKYDDGSENTITPEYSVVGNLPTGTSFSKGILTVTNSAESGSVTIKAACGTISKEVIIKINKAAAKEKVLQIQKDGSTIISDTLKIPETDSTISSYCYTVKVYDQYGKEMTAHEKVLWSLDSSEGVSCTAGTVKINNKVKENTTVTMTAKLENTEIKSEVKLTLCKKEAHQIGNFKEETLSCAYGDQSKGQTVASKTGGEISYSSNKGDIVSVDGKTGVLQIKKTGTAVITATAAESNDYAPASVSYTVLVNPKNLEESMVASVTEKYIYNGSECKPEPVVSDGDLITSSDYAYSYNNNLNAGTATVIISGKGNYTGSVSRSFDIQKCPMAAENVNVSSVAPRLYNGMNDTHADDITFTFTGVESADKTITVTAKNNKFADGNVGANKSIILGDLAGTGIENYDITYPEVKAQITPKPVKVEIKGDYQAAYKSAFTHTASAALLDGDQAKYTVLYEGKTTKPTEVGTYHLTATLDNKNYTVENCTGIKTFKIVKAGKDDCLTVSMADWRYGDTASNLNVKFNSPDGQVEIAPKTTVTYSGTDAHGQDYPASSEQPVNPGNYIVTVSYEDSNYNASSSEDFRILKANTLTVTGLQVNNKEYNKTVNAETTGNITVSGQIGEDTVTAGSLAVDKAEFKDVNVGSNKPVDIRLTGELEGTDAWKYEKPEMNYKGLTADITAKPVQIIIQGASEASYKSAFAHIASATLLDGDQAKYKVLYAGETTKPTEVGTYQLTATLDNKNYKAQDQFGGVTEFKITQALANDCLKVSMADWRYGEASSKPVIDFKMPAGHTGNSVKTTVTYSGTDEKKTAYEDSDKQPVNPGKYKVTVSYEDSNHKATKSADFSILKANTLTVTGLQVNNKEYDNTVNAVTTGNITVSGQIGEDAVTAGSLAVDKAEFKDVNVGSNKPVDIRLKGEMEGTDAWKYEKPVVTLYADITKLEKPIILNPDTAGEEQQKIIENSVSQDIVDTYPDVVKKHGDTVEKLKETMIKEASKKNSEANKNNCFLDFCLQILENGKNWKENHEKKISFIVPYPQGTNKNFSFTVVHIDIKGEIENVSVDKNENGLILKNVTTSPFLLSWKAPQLPPEETDDPSGSQDDNQDESDASGNSGQAVVKPVAKAKEVKPAISQTNKEKKSSEKLQNQKEKSEDKADEEEILVEESEEQIETEQSEEQETVDNEESSTESESLEDSDVSEETKTDSFNFLWVLIPLILVGVLGLIAFLYFKNRNNENRE